MPVEIARRGAGRKSSTGRLKKIALAILGLVGQAEAELSLALIGNSEMRKLNAKYRRKDYPTDVLSFPMEVAGPAATRLLGDVIISVEKAREQAKEQDRTPDQEVATLLIHGIVHLLGYDHERSAKDARVMKRLEDKIFRQLCEQGLIKV
ncbi:MAG: rRNA maturation RNase YbeY [Candidatus Binatia bacterium]